MNPWRFASVVGYNIGAHFRPKAVLYLYSSGKIMSWQSSFTGGTVCMSNDEYMSGYPGNNGTPIAQPITNLDYSTNLNNFRDYKNESFIFS